MEEPTMLTVTKAAKILGINRDVLSDLIEQEKIPYHNDNYPFVIKRTDLKEYILTNFNEYIEARIAYRKQVTNANP
jgi:excisionase family DNA binding protein